MARLALSLLLLSLTAAAAPSIPPRQWPGFRGPSAAGVADGVHVPSQWNVASGKNVRWRVEIPGLAHSSPIVWSDRVFVTTAVSSRGGASFKPGLYGEGTASEDRSPHRWLVLALDRQTGRVLWQQTAYHGPPREQRHIKATYANATPVTNGQLVVAFFGSQGLYAFDLDGKPVWQKDLGVLDTGAYDLPEYEWGTASSPIIYNDLVIVQCDMQRGSFILAADTATGRTVWKTARTELPSWGTPTVYPARNGRPAELVTNSPNYIRGYDPGTGAERWRLGGSSKITAPTPVFSKDLIIVASGRSPERPIFAIKPGASGDITLKDNQTSSKHVRWSRTARGPYMPTPLIYDGLLYVLANQGLLDAYDLDTGEEIYRQRIPHGGSGFSASPVAADGRIYLSSEDGDVFVVRAGRNFELLGRYPMGEPLMATPALAANTLFVRGERHLTAIGNR